MGASTRHDVPTSSSRNAGPGAGELGIDASSGLTQLRSISRVPQSALGYRRYWFAEHHLNPGVAGSSPALLIAMAAAATDRIRARIGRRAEWPPDRALRGRGVRSSRRHAPRANRPRASVARAGRNFFRDRLARLPRPQRDRPPPETRHTENGLLVPAPPSLRGLAKAPRIVADRRPAPARERRVRRLRAAHGGHSGSAAR